jgi:splicing factor 3A subunit 2
MKETQLMIAPAPAANVQRKQFVKIGRPGYRVTKVRERVEYDAIGNIVPANSPEAVTMSSREGMMVCVHLPHIKEGVLPRKRFMSAWEQKKEPPNRAFQYLIVSDTIYSFHR